MKTQITITTSNNKSVTLTISAGKGKPVYHWKGWHKQYRIKVTDGSYSTTFTYYDSQVNFKKDYLTTEDLVNAMDCIVSDALNYVDNQTFLEFAVAFCYSDDQVAEARRAFNGCRSTFVRLSEFGLNIDDLGILLDKVRELQEA